MELIFVPEGESNTGGLLGRLKPPSDKTSTSPRAKPWGFESGLSESRCVQTAAAAAATAEWDEVEEKAPGWGGHLRGPDYFLDDEREIRLGFS